MILPFGLYGYSIAVYVIGIMIAVGGLFIGAGYATNNKKLKEFGADELSQSIVNGMLVGGMLLLFANNGIVSSLISGLTLSNGTSMICEQYMQGNVALCLAYNYLAGQGYTFMGVYHQSILASVSETMALLFGLNAALGVIGSIGVSLFGFTLSFGSAVAPMLSIIQYLIKGLTTVAIGALVQSAVLATVAASSNAILLPLGLILRTFYPTRRLGGFIIALAVGLYVVLPLSYVLDATIASTYPLAMNLQGLEQVSANAGSVKAQLLSLNTQGNGHGVIASITDAVSSLISGFYGILNDLLQMLSLFIVYTFILPAFSLVLTAVSVRELSRILGSENSFWILDLV